MIFSHGLHQKVLRGQKSETRRVVKPGETECRYRVGNDYAVQAKRTEPELGRIRILATEKQRLGDISLESVKREGFKTRDEFEQRWCELHGSFDPDQEVWAIVFMQTEPVRLLARDSSRRYVSGSMEALGMDTAGGDQDKGRQPEPEPEAVDDETLARFRADADANKDRRREVMRSRLAQMRQIGIEHIKAGMEPEQALDLAYEQIRSDQAA